MFDGRACMYCSFRHDSRAVQPSHANTYAVAHQGISVTPLLPSSGASLPVRWQRSLKAFRIPCSASSEDVTLPPLHTLQSPPSSLWQGSPCNRSFHHHRQSYVSVLMPGG